MSPDDEGSGHSRAATFLGEGHSLAAVSPDRTLLLEGASGVVLMSMRVTVCVILRGVAVVVKFFKLCGGVDPGTAIAAGSK